MGEQLAVEAKEIKRILIEECRNIEDGTQLQNDYAFQLCEAGRAYVEHLMFEFEFFSNRVSNNNKPLYMYQKCDSLKRVLNNVFNALCNFVIFSNF